MGPTIVLFFWLFIAAIGVALWLGALALFVGGRRRQSRAMTWLGALSLAVGSVTALGVVGAVIYGSIWNSRAENIYQLSFGVAPSPDVAALQTSNSAFADSGTTFLKFRAAPATINRLTDKSWNSLNGKEWEDEDFGYFRSENTPSWWKPAKSKTTRIFVAHQRFKNFASEEEILIYDPVTGQTYYAFTGID